MWSEAKRTSSPELTAEKVVLRRALIHRKEEKAGVNEDGGVLRRP
jgi:hypothetical protein